jgi:O-antigen ligase
MSDSGGVFGAIGVAAALATIAVMVFGAWFLSRMLNLVIRVCVRYPCSTMWIALGVFFSTWILFGVCLLMQAGRPSQTWQMGSVVAGIVAGLASIALCVTARVVEEKHSDLYEAEKQSLITRELKSGWQGWWSPVGVD